jgi:hypothetical protein
LWLAVSAQLTAAIVRGLPSLRPCTRIGKVLLSTSCVRISTYEPASFLSCDGQRVEDLRDRAGADLRELLEGLLRLRVQRIANSADLRDQPLSFQIRKETHPALRSALACVTHYATAAALQSAPREPARQDPSIVLMTTPPEVALREAVESYVDPYLGLELRAAGALRGLNLDAEQLAIALTPGIPGSPLSG